MPGRFAAVAVLALTLAGGAHASDRVALNVAGAKLAVSQDGKTALVSYAAAGKPLQTWQPKLPHRGYPPYRADQTGRELDVSHWTGPLARLEVHADWAFGKVHDLFGRLTRLLQLASGDRFCKTQL